jgi:hypothetical protein
MKGEQRAMICFLWAEGVPGAEMHRRMSVKYGNSVVLQQSITNGLRGSKMVTQALSMRKELNQPLKKIVHAWLVFQPKTFYSKGNDRLSASKSKGTMLKNDALVKIYALVVINVKHTLQIVIDSPSYIIFSS